MVDVIDASGRPFTFKFARLQGGWRSLSALMLSICTAAGMQACRLMLLLIPVCRGTRRSSPPAWPFVRPLFEVIRIPPRGIAIQTGADLPKPTAPRDKQRERPILPTDN